MRSDSASGRAPERDSFRSAGFFVFRTPLLSLTDFLRLTPQRRCDGALATDDSEEEHRRNCVAALQTLWALPSFQSALQIASPDLHQALVAERNTLDSPKNSRLVSSLARYASRAATRATPFGTFAAVGIGSFREKTHLQVPVADSWRVFVRPDGELARAVVERLRATTGASSAQRVESNSTLYRVGDEWRFLTPRRHTAGTTRYSLESVKCDAVLDDILARARDCVEVGELVDSLTGVGYAPEEAVEFVDACISAQLLVSSEDISATGVDVARTLSTLVRTHKESARDLSALFDRATAEWEPSDLAGVQDSLLTSMSSTAALASHLDVLGPTTQVDTMLPELDYSLGPELLATIVAGVQLLSRLGDSSANQYREKIEAFGRRISDVYGDVSMPLLEALDPETGIGWQGLNRSTLPADPLLATLDGPTPSVQRSRTPVSDYILRLIADALQGGKDEVVLTEEDVTRLGALSGSGGGSATLPTCFAALIVLEMPEAGTAQSPRAMVRYTHGASGASWWARFCHHSATLTEHTRRYFEQEEALQPNVRFFEISHAPGPRHLNFVSRPHLRRFETPILAPRARQGVETIELSDIEVVVEEGEVRLTSRSARCDVVPRISNAHAPDSEIGVAAYEFLFAYQHCGTVPRPWTSGIPALPYTPRIRCGSLVLSLARWTITAEECARLIGDGRPLGLAKRVMAWRRARAVPRLVRLEQGDNELAVDWENPLSVRSVLHLIRDGGGTLVEFFPAPGRAPAHGSTGDHAFEIVIPFLPTRAPANARASGSQHIARDVGSPSENWIYMKLYCGTTSVERLLRDNVPELRDAFRDRFGTDEWFFIRYADPDPHLRLRFNMSDEDAWASGMLAARRWASRLESNRRIARWTFDGYVPESRRYGGHEGIDVAHTLFRLESDAFLGMLLDLGFREDPTVRTSYAFWQLHLLFASLDRDSEQSFVSEAISRSIRAGVRVRDAKKRLAKEFRQMRPLLMRLLDGEYPTLDASLIPLVHVTAAGIRDAARRYRALDQGAALVRPLRHIALSLSHMCVNRIFRERNNHYEAVIYDLLSQALRAAAMPRSPTGAPSGGE